MVKGKSDTDPPNETKMDLTPLSVVLSLIVLSTCFGLLGGNASAQTPFYKDKTITIIQGRRAGGTGDMRLRAAMPFLEKYIPGNPKISTLYMPGAAGTRAISHVFKSVRPNGLTIGNASGGFLMNAILGAAGVRFDMFKLIYLGSSYSTNHTIFVTRKELGLTSLEKLRAASGLRLGAQSVGHVIYVSGRIFAYLLRLKDPKFVTGYSGPEMELALARAEIDGRANGAANLMRQAESWQGEGPLNMHAVIEIPKGLHHPKFSKLPEVESFVKTKRMKDILHLFRSIRLIGGPFVLPPGVPKERVAILREAMSKTFKDPEFRPLFKKLSGGDPSPISGEQIRTALREMPRDPEVTDFFKKLAGPGPLP